MQPLAFRKPVTYLMASSRRRCCRHPQCRSCRPEPPRRRDRLRPPLELQPDDTVISWRRHLPPRTARSRRSSDIENLTRLVHAHIGWVPSRGARLRDRRRNPACSCRMQRKAGSAKGKTRAENAKVMCGAGVSCGASYLLFGTTAIDLCPVFAQEQRHGQARGKRPEIPSSCRTARFLRRR